MLCNSNITKAELFRNIADLDVQIWHTVKNVSMKKRQHFYVSMMGL